MIYLDHKKTVLLFSPDFYLVVDRVLLCWSLLLGLQACATMPTSTMCMFMCLCSSVLVYVFLNVLCFPTAEIKSIYSSWPPASTHNVNSWDWTHILLFTSTLLTKLSPQLINYVFLKADFLYIFLPEQYITIHGI